MIYTVTFNPSLDYYVVVDHFKAGAINRTKEEVYLPGGKGINVSMCLGNLGFQNTALGFIGGNTGAEIQRLLQARGVDNNFIWISNGNSRVNVKIRSLEGAPEDAIDWVADDPMSVSNAMCVEETAINGIGPEVGADDLGTLYARLGNLVDGDVLVLSGAIPGSLPPTIYEDILRFLEGRKILYVVDAEGELLLNVLKYHPFLIKPNREELGGLFEVQISDSHEAEPYARRLQEMGARNVMVSLGSHGSMLLTEEGEVLRCPALSGKVFSTVGAGDSMIAGFIAGYLNHGNYRDAFKVANCTCGACVQTLQMPTRTDVVRFMERQTFEF